MALMMLLMVALLVVFPGHMGGSAGHHGATDAPAQSQDVDYRERPAEPAHDSR